MLNISKIYMDYEENQTGITHVPQFSWRLESDKKNALQSSYELVIAKDKDFSEIVYDSKKVESDRSAQILPEGLSLDSVTKYYVKVRVSAGEDTSDWKETSFVTGLMDNSQWKGCFITAEEETDADDSKGTYVRKAFSLKGKVKEAYACATALGLYNFYINGKKVGTDELTPGWTSYLKHLCYQTYDVTSYLQEGENAMGAMLAAGWFKGKMGFDGLVRRRNHYGKNAAFLAQMTVRYEDGTEEVFVTDTSWTGADSPVVFAEIYDGEIYDARKEIEGWAEAGTPAGNWRPVRKIEYDLSVLTGQGCGKVAEMDEVKPKRIFKTPEGDTVIDFGQNMTGHIRVTAEGKAGDVIELDCFEVLDAAGNVYLDNLRGAKEALSEIFNYPRKFSNSGYI